MCTGTHRQGGPTPSHLLMSIIANACAYHFRGLQPPLLPAQAEKLLWSAGDGINPEWRAAARSSTTPETGAEVNTTAFSF